jgi:hypothetical protein
MAKREDSGSGLRAGFTRADASVPQNRKAGRKAEPKPDNEPVEKTEEVVETPPPASEPEEHANAPTITMQGVSGKKITGVVKVVKRVAKADTEEPAPASGAIETEEPSAAETTAPVRTAAKPAEEVPAPVKEAIPVESAVTPATPPAVTTNPPPAVEVPQPAVSQTEAPPVPDLPRDTAAQPADKAVPPLM